MTTPLPQYSLPLRPDLGQLKRQAKELLRDHRSGDPQAAALFARFHPGVAAEKEARLADAQLVLARAYGATSWPRLVQSCQLVDAIWKDDAAAVRELVSAHPGLIHEDALVRPEGQRSNWGPPMSHAANLGRDQIIRMLHGMGATDHAFAIDRATLQGKIATARMIHDLSGRPIDADDLLGGAAYTLTESGTAFAFEVGARAVDATGRRLAPVHVVLGSDSRKPAAKHAILAMYEAHGLVFPDTAPMALHRGRIDLLEKHLAADAGMLNRQFRWEEIYPPDMGCHDETRATHGTPLKGATLLHMCCDYDELAIAEWLIAKGADVNARAAVDGDGFGGHTPLFSAVVSQHHFWMNYGGGKPSTDFAGLLLKHGADPNIRVSLRKQMHPGYGPDVLREFRDVTPLSWGRRFHRKEFVGQLALDTIEAAGGIE